MKAQVDEILEFEASDRFDERERTALRWAMAIAWNPALADDQLWERLRRHFSEPQLVELGHFIALTLGQQRFLKTAGVRHGEVLADTTPASHRMKRHACDRRAQLSRADHRPLASLTAGDCTHRTS